MTLKKFDFKEALYVNVIKHLSQIIAVYADAVSYHVIFIRPIYV